MGKKFDTTDTTAKFFTQPQQEAPAEPIAPEKEEKKSKGRPPLPPDQKRNGKRFNLLLDQDLDKYLHEIVWVKRTNMTQYINDLIRADYNEYLKFYKAKGVDPFEGWETE